MSPLATDLTTEATVVTPSGDRPEPRRTVGRLCSRRAVLRALVIESLCLGLLVLLVVWLRLPQGTGVDGQGVLSEDAATITYGADLLRRGQLPAVDSSESDGPGAPLLAALAFAAAGRSLRALGVLSLVFALLSVFGVFLIGRLVFGRAAALCAAAICTIALATVDGIACSRGAWMTSLYVLGMVFFVAGLRTRQPVHFGLAAVLSVWAALVQGQAVLILPVYLVVLLSCARGAGGVFGVLGVLGVFFADGSPALARRHLAAFLGGVLGGVAPLILLYLIRGGPGGLVGLLGQLLPCAPLRSFFGEANLANAARETAVTLWQRLPLPALLALGTLVALPLGRWRQPASLSALGAGLLVVGALCSLRSSAPVASRFLLLMPPLALWAAHPDGVLLRWFARRPIADGGGRVSGFGWLQSRQLIPLVFLVCGAAPAGLVQAASLVTQRQAHAMTVPLSAETRAVGELIQANTQPGDRIWAPAATALPVYFFAHRVAPGRHYQVGDATPAGCRVPAKVLADELRAGRPAFVVLGGGPGGGARGSAPAVAAAPEIADLLKRDYLKLTRFRLLQVHQRKDLRLDTSVAGPRRGAASVPGSAVPSPRAGGQLHPLEKRHSKTREPGFPLFRRPGADPGQGSRAARDQAARR